MGMKRFLPVILVLISIICNSCAPAKQDIEKITEITKSVLDKKSDQKEESDTKPKTDLSREFSYTDLRGVSFTFSSGAGGWGTSLIINPDGSFSGTYLDSEMGIYGEEYPNGTVYICKFLGKFSALKKIDNLTYSTKIESLSCEKPVDTVEYDDGQRYIYTEPYGLQEYETIYFYLNGTPLSSLSEEHLTWLYYNFDDDTDKLPFISMYNEKLEYGFYSNGAFHQAENLKGAQNAILCPGEAVSTGDIVYYSHPGSGFNAGIYAYNTKTHENKLFFENLIDGQETSHGFSDLGIYKDNIFFTWDTAYGSVECKNYIYCLNISTKKHSKLAMGSHPIIIDNKIYYLEEEIMYDEDYELTVPNGNICRMNLDGSNKTVVKTIENASYNWDLGKYKNALAYLSNETWYDFHENEINNSKYFINGMGESIGKYFYFTNGPEGMYHNGNCLYRQDTETGEVNLVLDFVDNNEIVSYFVCSDHILVTAEGRSGYSEDTDYEVYMGDVIMAEASGKNYEVLSSYWLAN